MSLDASQRLTVAVPCEKPRIFDRACVRINGTVAAQPAQRLAAGDRLELKYDPSQRYHPRNRPRRNLGFEVIFEDPHLLVVDKPAGLLSVS